MTIHDILHDISEQSDADTSNLWHRIAHQIEEDNLMRKAKNRRLRLSATWVVALLGILVMSSAIFGRSQRQLYHPVTIEDIERMASPLNLVESNDDMTIQLDWAYADESQIVLAYTLFDANGDLILGQDIADGGQVEIRHLYPMPSHASVSMFSPKAFVQNPDSAQQVLRYTISGGTYFESLSSFLSQNIEINESGVIQLKAFFYAPSHTPHTASHTFDFEIPFALSDFEQHNNLISDMYTWDTSEPVSEIELYFNDLVITPSQTLAYMCVRFPDDTERTWYIPASVDMVVNERRVEATSFPYPDYVQWADLNDTYIRVDAFYFALNSDLKNYCMQFTWHIAFEGLPQTLRIEIPEFYRGIDHHPENPISQAYVNLYAEEGYQIDYVYNEEFDFTDIVYPPEFEALNFEARQQIDQNMREALHDLYPLDERFSFGWEYTFELNPEEE